MPNYVADDFETIRQRITKLREENGSEVRAVTPLPLAAGTELDIWGKLLDLSRNYCEADDAYRARLAQHAGRGGGF